MVAHQSTVQRQFRKYQIKKSAQGSSTVEKTSRSHIVACPIKTDNNKNIEIKTNPQLTYISNFWSHLISPFFVLSFRQI